jgi:hypothetical protein
MRTAGNEVDEEGFAPGGQVTYVNLESVDVSLAAALC